MEPSRREGGGKTSENASFALGSSQPRAAGRRLTSAGGTRTENPGLAVTPWNVTHCRASGREESVTP
jgi:hypothetical protein